MTDLDNQAARLFDTSALVRGIERGARALRTAAVDSRSIAIGRSWFTAARPHPGALLVAAALTHIVLMIAIARPVYWQWSILPSIALAAGALLLLQKK